MRSLSADQLIRELQSANPWQPKPLYVLTGDETLLVNECLDALRKAATTAGYGERISLNLDARSDWSSLQAATQSISLFGDKPCVTVSIPSGRPGRTGGEALQALAEQAQAGQIAQAIVVITLPRLDRASRSSKWARALLANSVTIEIGQIDRTRLPQWIGERLARQEQQVDRQTLEWMADHVEGNLLAAHQEIQKLALLHPKGNIATHDVEQAVLSVARYNVFGLRDAMLAGHPQRTLTILEGLRSEGEAPPLVLWAIGDEIRVLARLAAARDTGTLQSELRKQRVFSSREALIRKALDRVAPSIWPAAVQHAHDIDRLIKGLPPAGRLLDPWAELARLALRVAIGTRASRA